MLHSLLATLVVAVALQAPAPEARKADDIEFCLSCHGDPQMSVELPSGETRSLAVDAAVFAGSVHGGKLACADCHPGMDEVPHPPLPFATKRDFTIAYYEACKRCHFANYSKTLDSVHQAAVARGDVTAPVCVDCHGAHDITPPHEPRTRISQMCATCHEGVALTYARSVHGRALTDNNADVPTCTDCHRAHDVAGPQAPGWRLRSPELCASCHADESMMQKYGISANVMQTYVADFHGMTASLQRKDQVEGGAVVALCIDCHGVHDIVRADEEGSSVMQANLLSTCQRCHPGATPNFSSAWLSHYEPTFANAPLVYAVRIGYLVLIPFMIGGLVLQILLHLWRVVVNR
ncbi:MAG TPA: cytochrome c3 family protein [Vicinamibacterales bacterium]|nr:cytochrome c3 family protein [Vicinamibacterales bacterium]